MIRGAGNIFKIPDLRRKIIFTIAMMAVYRLGCHIPTPGINAAALGYLLTQLRGTVFGLYDIFVGGALSRASIFALGIMPYISASIIFQLLGSVFPTLARLQRDEEGRKRINQYTRYATVGLAMVQAIGISLFLEGQAPTPVGPIVPVGGFGFRFLAVLTMTTGTIFVMWLGELITEKGIGNGISFIIFVGCLDTIPRDIAQTVQSIRAGTISGFAIIPILLIVFGIFAAVVLMTQAMRRIPVQYPKRIIGRRMYGGQSTFIPLRVNTAGVIPIIFAQSLLVFPSTIATFAAPSFAQTLQGIFAPGHWLYDLLFAGLIIFFAYFYTSIVFNPQDLADNMRRYGGFVPGIRPGQPTANHIDRVLSRITLPGAIFLAFIALLPWYLMNLFHVPFYFGGTTLLIIVGVALDTLEQIESHLLMRHYEGFLRSARIRGRRY
jgi:preprotein translocase subunit SecY